MLQPLRFFRNGGGQGGGNIYDFLNNILSALESGGGGTWTATGNGGGTYNFNDICTGTGTGDQLYNPGGDEYDGQKYEIADRMENGVYMHGALFVESFNITGFNYTTYQWIQLANVDPGRVVNGNAVANPVVDGDYDNNGCQLNYPFYYESTDNFNYSKNTVFADEPGTSRSDYSFSAQTTVVGINSQGMTALGSFNWGYQVNNNVTSLLPLTNSATPNAATSNIIKMVNALTAYNSMPHLY